MPALACYWLAHTPLVLATHRSTSRRSWPPPATPAAPRLCRGPWPSITAAGSPPSFTPPPLLRFWWRRRSFAPALRCWCRPAAPPLVAGCVGPWPSSLLSGDALTGHDAEEPTCVLSFKSSSRFVFADADKH